MPLKLFKLSSILTALWGASVLYAQALDKSNLYASHWDHVPVNFHFGKTKGVLSDAEIDFLASYNGWIVLEKRHGLLAHGSTEAGIAATAKRLKRSNRGVKVLFYLNAFINWPGYEAYETYQPEWDLRDASGNIVYKSTDVARPDPSNPEFRVWWSEVIAEQMKDGLIDGVFVDALPQVLHKRLGAQVGAEKAQAIVAGVREMIALTKQKIGPDKYILANGTRGEDYREILDWSGLDGVMIEHFDAFNSHDPATVKADLETIQLAADKGKFVVIKAWPGFAWNDSEMMQLPHEELLKMARERITFPLACFLVAARADSQFCYSWGYREKHGFLDTYPEFEKPLGPPEADAVWDGMTATRKFKHASVWVDLVSKEARINWH
ncbi:putative glycoside hydrolase [Coraliomargarita algicola]|uniref:Glycoside hydrolase n=1 Tax=Coraliomargarita algicola TaxID=3092156 RepID=A0ABZ0RM47_9BACT|nr:putative glycoside hydrolase [Coraliomargarita sp. J2-16]WPJ96231.1 putative glycoside hydrolase [Coraliomargarita sp. J2-16]